MFFFSSADWEDSEQRGVGRNLNGGSGLGLDQTQPQTQEVERELTCDTMLTLAGVVGAGAGVALVSGADGTPAGLVTGVPPAVITV